MRTIVHLSDLHFGRVDEATTEPLVAHVSDIKPDLVVISGDLTQRARTGQFQAARKFLERLPKPQIVVPGNHDVPAYNLLRRFFQPLKKYRVHVNDNLLPSYVDDEMAIFGLNSTLSFTTKYGRLRALDIEAMGKQLAQLPDTLMKIVVCHHPFDLPPSHSQRDLIRGAESAMRSFAGCGVDLILSGHLHISHTSSTAQRYQIPGHSALVVQAGTAISNRQRGELNSFNVLRIDAGSLIVDRMTWDTERLSYGQLKTEKFKQSSEGWLPVDTASK